MSRTKEAGMTVVELLITLFVASAFLISGFQLYTTIIRDGGEARAQAKASSVVNEYLKEYELEVTMPCSGQTPLNNEEVEIEGLSAVFVTVNITCPFPDNTQVSNVVVVLTYGSSASVVSTAAYVSGDTDPTLVGWWPMDGNANDASGNDNNGEVNSASLTYDRFGRANRAYSFDGVNDYIAIDGLANQLATGDDFTLVAWFKTSSVPSDMHRNMIFSAHNSSSYGNVFRTGTGTTGGIFSSVDIDDNQNGSGYNDGNWHMLSLSIGGDGTTTVSVDGNAISGFNNDQAPWNTASYFSIGQEYDAAGPGDFFSGALDDVRVYDRVLTSQDIQQLYGGGEDEPNVDDDLVGWWPLTGDANDHSTNSNHGTVSGATPTGGYDGTPDGAYSFDGVNDVIAIPDSDFINTAASYSEKTISLWFHPHSTDGKQILYEQGGTTKGLNLYIDSGSLYVNGWSLNDEDATTPWGSTYLSTNIAPGSWNHVVLTLDASSSITGYLNGNNFDSSANVGNLFTHTGDINLGGLGDSTVLHDGVYSDPATFNGAIDDLKLWNRSLSASEVTNIYNAGSSSSLFGLVGWWPMNDNANDATSSGLAGSVSGASLATGQNGSSNGSYSFDGSNDFITIPNDPLLNTGTSYGAKTLSLWFYANDVSGRRVLYEQGGSGNGLNLYIDSGSVYVGVWSTNNGWGPYYVDAGIVSATWNNITLVYDQDSSSLEGYLNGSSVGNVSGPGLLNSHSNENGIGQVSGSTLFHDSTTGAVDYYNGRIDDLRAYNRALSASEVEALYEAGAY